MAIWRFLVACLVLSCLVETSYGVTTLASLNNTLSVTASFTHGQVLKAGEDSITITWSPLAKPGTDSTYKTVNLKLCYAPISQVDRAWRKTVDDLAKDKTCQFKIVVKPYTTSNSSFNWTIKKEIPTATYFVRAYVLNSDGVQVAFGQSTDAQKEKNLFMVEGISGRHVSLDICAVCFSAFSVLSLFGFFYFDRRNAKMK